MSNENLRCWSWQCTGKKQKKEVCVIDDKYITLGEENGQSLLQEVITDVEELWKTLNEFKGQEIKATSQIGESHLYAKEKYFTEK